MNRILNLKFPIFVCFVLSVVNAPSFASNIYPWRIITGSTTGIVDEVLFTDTSDLTLSITNLPGGGRRANIDLLASGGGGGTTSNALTNAASATPALIGLTINNGTLTISPNTQILTNSGTQALFWNGALAVSNNATVTGNLSILGTLTVPGINTNNYTIHATNCLLITDLDGGGTNLVIGLDPSCSLGTGGGGNTNIWYVDGTIAATNDSFGFLSTTPALGTLVFTNAAGIPSIALNLNSSLAFTSVTNGLALSSVTNGLALSSVTNGLALSSVTNGLATQSSLLATASVLQAEINDLPTGSGMTTLSNNLIAALNLTNDAIRTGPMAITNGLALSSVTNGLATTSVTNGLATPSVTNGLATISVTNNLPTTSITNSLVAQTSLLALTNPLVAQASLPVITNSLIDSSHAVTNSYTPSLGLLGPLTVSNNATITGTFHVLGALAADGGVVGAVTSAVASVNGLLSNVTIATTGNATISSTTSSNGGTITINVPQQFAETNPPSASPSPIFWDTKYGSLRVSNNFGSTFIDTPQLSGGSNVVDSMSSWFTSSMTDAWIQINWTNSISVGNTNNWLWISSAGDGTGQGRYLLRTIPNTNQSWRCRILVQPLLGQNGTITMNEGFGLVSAESTNGPLHLFTTWRGSGGIPELRAFVPASPTTTYSSTVEAGVDSSSIAQWWGGSSALENGPHVPFWMQISYDGSSTQKYSYCLSQNGLPPPIITNGQYTFIKTNQTINPQCVGICVDDGSSAKITIAIKAFVFEQP